MSCWNSFPFNIQSFLERICRDFSCSNIHSGWRGNSSGLSRKFECVNLKILEGFLIGISVTDPNSENRGFEWVAGLECILNVIRVLRMGSCLSGDSRSPQPSSPVRLQKRKGSKKRLGSQNSSFDYKREEQLHRTPGRMFLNGSSEIASLFTQRGKKGTNQDAMIVWEVTSSSFITIWSVWINWVTEKKVNMIVVY